jgi:UPF0176 protein
MSNSNFEILLYYKYINIDNPEELKDRQRILCQSLNLKGRIIVATEGINGTVEGLKSDITKYIKAMQKDSRFKDIDFKKSQGMGNAFPKLSVKARSEIVAARLGKDDIDPAKLTGKYVTVKTLHDWIHSGKKFYIVDMRNDFEQKSGYFKDSILPNFKSFADLPEVLPILSKIKNEPIVTVCTGGVRCEKASGFLLSKGFNEVYQLFGGIVAYMEKYPNEDFLGKLYVFDNRLTIGFNLDEKEHVVVGKCEKCNKSCDDYVNCAEDFCHRHYLLCKSCYHFSGMPFCNEKCFQKYLVNTSLNL